MRRLILAPLALLLVGQASSDPASVIAERLKAFPIARSVEAVEAYQPAEMVKGGRAAALPKADSGAIGIAPAAIDAAEAYAREQGSFAFIVMRDGRVVRESYWQGFGPASGFSTASMHKAVMALAFGPAVASGRIALDDPVSRHLPEWRDDPRGRITVAQLLRMESGLETPPPAPPGPAARGTQMMFGPDIRATALAWPASGPPGTEFAYGNVNSQLAGMALQRAVGRRYSDWLSARIWRPIGAGDASLWLDRPGGMPHFFCCLQASARDWARVGELIRLKGRVGRRQIVPASWIAAMAAPGANNPNFGLQLWRGSPHARQRRYGTAIAMTIPAAEPFARDDVLFIDGAGGQRVYIVPSAGLTIVRIGKPSVNWDDSRLPNLLLRGL